MRPGETFTDLLHRLGDLPPERVRFDPAPGTATIADLLKPENKLCELVDGVLVARPAGFIESSLTSWLAMHFNNVVAPPNLGIVTGAAGLMELADGLVRAPALAFTSWARMPARRLPIEPVPQLVPNLVVEVLSPSNTVGEMARKRAEYFRSGVELVWEIDPRARTARVYTAPDRHQALTAADTLAGDPVLPGFTVPLVQLFAELDRHG